ncbi:aminotransferase class I/II-fold pyridoxal phosphate-dependent enzyme [Siculibacillus lacustris]|uniref:Aminotransferase class I/II-fold pyridoxal phosphate-dependent enzyme n=1 Tax=Siculibacillus lacustris TaxID=1549641 RepID=A0A4Q9VLG3_9HYPH|nr:aminotransferase class I/II-fold pyridoxal phosphate-dependent enzyme [Siculibacillus lacustris]TBW36297.1 aminotransferase class I/II-fold pyridoxal phosphate-dependent enzyme [Siculibacillus lacustris]
MSPAPTSSPAAESPAIFASPFQKLADLLAPHAPGRSPINLTVGEPRHPVPGFVAPILAAETAGFGRYPPIKGTPEFRGAVAGWLDRRFGLNGRIDPETQVLPLNGSREGLFFAALEARRTRKRGIARPTLLLPNPFYQAYAAGAAAAGCEAVLIEAGPETGFLPDLTKIDRDLLDRAVAIYYASPANPQGSVASRADWREVIDTARRHDFLVFADECYSEIHRDGMVPDGVLSVALETPEGFDGIVAFNSLSKRSNLPGLRCGFAAGDAAFLAAWAGFRNMAAPQVPGPIQAVAVAALADEAHVIENRRLYDLKYAAAERIIGTRWGHRTPPGGFFLWLDVSGSGGGETAAMRLWVEAGVRTVPGSYLCGGGAGNPGEAYLRVAMVESLAATEEALGRIVETLG